MVVCAFPASGKTYLVKSNPRRFIDFDYGKFRDMFGLTFSEEKGRGHNVVSRYYSRFVNQLSEKFIVFTNEPKVHYLDPVFVIPSYSRDEWLDRIKRRGDFLEADWVRYIYTHFDHCVEEWSRFAKEQNARIIYLQCNQYLADVVYQINHFKEKSK